MTQDKQENNEMVITVEQDSIGPPGDTFIYEGPGLTTISGSIVIGCGYCY